jgi:hypothetical protein
MVELLSLKTLGFIKAYFLFLGSHLLNEDDDLNKWLNNDGFTEEQLKDGEKMYLLRELDKLKTTFKKDMYEKEVLKDENGNPLSPLDIYKLIEAHKIRIEKVRLMVKGEFLTAEHLHKASGITYIVARAYWIDNKGKKFRKFSKNIGTKDAVMSNGVIPKSRIKDIKSELLRLMWSQYHEEYGEVSK